METNDLLPAKHLKHGGTSPGFLASTGAGRHLRWWNHGHLRGVSPFQDGLEGCSLTWAGQVRVSGNKTKETGLPGVAAPAVVCYFCLFTWAWTCGISLYWTLVTMLIAASQAQGSPARQRVSLVWLWWVSLGWTPTQLLAFPPQQDGESWEGSWIKVKMWRLLTSYCCGQNRLALGRV